VDSCVVVGHLHSDVSSIFAFEIELMPQIVLATAWDYHISQVDPSFADEVGLLVIVEDGALELIVIGRLVNGESKLLVPEQF